MANDASNVPQGSGNGRDGEDRNDQGQGSGREFVPPKDGSWVPRTRLDEAIHNERRRFEEKIKELESKVEKMGQQQSPPVSRAELARRVENGELTEDQAQQMLEEQAQRQIERQIEQRVTEVVSSRDRASTVNADIQRYIERVPGVATPGTEQRARIEREYNYFVNTLGYPANNATELAALRSVFGPAESIAVNSGSSEPDSNGETHGSGGGDGGNGRASNDGAPKELTGPYKRYYEDQIRKGRYKDWDDVKAELKHANPELIRRMGAR